MTNPVIKQGCIVTTILFHIVHIIPITCANNAWSINVNKMTILNQIAAHRYHVDHVGVTSTIDFEVWNLARNPI